MLSARFKKKKEKKDAVAILVVGIYKREKNGEEERERRKKGSSTDAKVFQFSALKHEPTPQLGCPGRLLNKTLIIQNTVDCILLKTYKL